MIQISETFSAAEEPELRSQRVLRDLQGTPTYHAEYQVRHPLGAYNHSISAVTQCGLRLLDSLGQIDRATLFLEPRKIRWEEHVLPAMDHFLDSLMEHVDDCKGVLRSFFPKSAAKDYEKALKGFKKDIEPYRSHIAKIDNHLKHHQGRLRGITFYWPGDACLGYFVEGVVEDGVIGPAPLVHEGSDSAFSFSRDIAYHLAGLYFTSAALARAVHSVNHKIRPTKPSSRVESQQNDWRKFVERVALLPDTYFPDEAKAAIPAVMKRPSGNVTIDFPSKRRRAPAPPPNAGVMSSYVGDGVTRSFKVPYSAPYVPK